jgi:hypothetical protein
LRTKEELIDLAEAFFHQKSGIEELARRAFIEAGAPELTDAVIRQCIVTYVSGFIAGYKAAKMDID